MSDHSKNQSQNTEKETPLTFPIGWILICLGVVPIIAGVKDSKIELIIAGSALIASGLILLLVGFIQSRKNK